MWAKYHEMSILLFKPSFVFVDMNFLSGFDFCNKKAVLQELYDKFVFLNKILICLSFVL